MSTNDVLNVESFRMEDAVSVESDDGDDTPSSQSLDRLLERLQAWFKSISIGTRSLIYIVPGLAALAVPAVLGYIVFTDICIASVSLHIWSIWLGVCWFSLFASRFVVFLIPDFLELILGLIKISAKQQMDYFRHLHFHVSSCLFLGISFVSFAPIMVGYNAAGGQMLDWQHIMKGILAVLFASSIIITVEKLFLQVVAVKFHETTYQDRIADSRYRVSVLTTLYAASRQRLRQSTTDSILSKPDLDEKQNSNLTRIFTRTTTALGQIASEITGHQFDDINQAEIAVHQHLINAHEAQYLGRRLFKAFCPSDRNHLLIEDISDYFGSKEAAQKAFYIFDKDNNGDLSKEEMIAACVEAYREREAIAASMRDLDHAVGKLDSILMVAIYFIIILLFFAFLDVSFQTYIATAGSILLALSFVVGSTAQALFECIIFLFVTHPFDVGDRVIIEDVNYIVKEMALLSTILIHEDGSIVQAANNILAQKFIHNIRRSGHMGHEVILEVDFHTTLEQVEALQERLANFLKGEDRDFYPELQLTIEKMPKLRQLILKVAVEHKSNWQDDNTTTRRKNKFMWQLKKLITDLDIKGPSLESLFPAEKMFLPIRYPDPKTDLS